LLEFYSIKTEDKKKEERILVATNRKARFHYEILETFEAGLVLKGPEVKSLRAGKAVLDGSFARCEGDEILLYNLHIAPYAHNTLEEIAPDRTRKLLLHAKEIRRLLGRQTLKGLTLVPLELYFRRGWAKVLIALGKGKRGPDKRDTLRKRQESRDMERSFKGKFKV
jgi:SsrA-binding protein